MFVVLFEISNLGIYVLFAYYKNERFKNKFIFVKSIKGYFIILSEIKQNDI